ncbi:MAG TPA: glycosyltransferase family 4 protein [Methyloceanibacter sp.]|nr:glycosyltransferase family 4 protein [Methyloceanibacter sp.]
MVTILQVVPRLDAGGSELATIEIAQALSRAGASALVATEGGRMADEVGKAGGEILTLPMASKSPFTILANIGRLTKLIRDRKVDLVHARSRAPAWSALLAARRTGKPFVTTYHGAYGEVGPFKAAYNSVMAKGDRVIANSRYTASVIEARDARAKGRIRVIYRGVDKSVFDPAVVEARAVDALRAAWGVPPGTKIVLHAARLTSIKGQRDLIAAAALAYAEGALRDAVVILAGDAPGRDAYREELLGLIARHGLGDKVRLVGHCSEMPAAYLASQVAVTTSTVPETFGRTSAEAQAMGCPVIVPDLGALPETIVAQGQGGFTGWLFPPRDIASLASRIGQALGLSAAERAAIGARAREHVAANFTLAQMQGATLAVYDELLGSDLGESFKRASPAELGAGGTNDR